MKGYQRPTESSLKKVQNKQPPKEPYYVGLPNMSGSGEKYSAVRRTRPTYETMSNNYNWARNEMRREKMREPIRNPRREFNAEKRAMVKNRINLLKSMKATEPNGYAAIVAANKRNTIVKVAPNRRIPVPNRPRPANIAPLPLLQPPPPPPMYSNTNVSALLNIITHQSKRMEAARKMIAEGQIGLRIVTDVVNEIFDAEQRNMGTMMYVPPSSNEVSARNNQVLRQIVRRRKNAHFLQRASRTRNAWVITYNDIKGVKFGMAAKGLEAARRNRTLPREANDIVGTVDRIRQAYQKAITPQQMRAWLDTVQAFVLVTQHVMMPIYRIAKELAQTAYMLEASHHAEIAGSMKILPSAAMSYFAPTLTPYRNDRTRSLGAACKIVMMTLMIAVLLLFVYLNKMRLIRRR